MSAVLSGLVLTGLSGLTMLAFRHPRAFARLYPYLNLAVSVLFLLLTAWHLAVQVTSTAVFPYVDRDAFAEAQAAVATLTIPYLWACAIYVALLAFFWICMRLPPFIKATEEDDVFRDLNG